VKLGINISILVSHITIQVLKAAIPLNPDPEARDRCAGRSEENVHVLMCAGNTSGHAMY
jgi:hypothetical protein